MKIIVVDDNRGFYDLLNPQGISDMILLSINKESDQSNFEIAKAINKIADGNANVGIAIKASLRGRRYTPTTFRGLEIAEEIRSLQHYLGEVSRIRYAPISIFSILPKENIKHPVIPDLIDLLPGVTYISQKPDRNLFFLKAREIVHANEVTDFFRTQAPELPSGRHSLANFHAAIQLIEDCYLLEPSPLLQMYWDALQSVKTRTSRIYQAVKNDVATSSINSTLLNNCRKEVRLFRAQIEENLRHCQGRIMLYDDQAESIQPGISIGWKHLFSLLLFDETNRVRSIEIEQSLDMIVRTKTPDLSLLLLDYYIEDRDHHFLVRDTKSMRLLKKLKRKNLFIPVIATTASDKVYTKDQLTELNCDGYWMKEGFEFQKRTRSSFFRAIDLIKLVQVHTSIEAVFFRQAEAAIRLLNDEKLWWESLDAWRRNCIGANPIVKNKLLSTIKEMLQNLRRCYLANCTSVESTSIVQSTTLLGIVTEVGGWLEKIHNCKSGKGKTGLMSRRKDILGKVIYQFRNHCVHKKIDLNLNITITFLKAFLLYLRFPPGLFYNYSNIGICIKSIQDAVDLTTPELNEYLEFLNGRHNHLQTAA